MRFSMFSASKKIDKEFQLEIGEMIETLARLGSKHNNQEALELAERFGHHYLTLEEKIKHHDYTLEDRAYDSINSSLYNH